MSRLPLHRNRPFEDLPARILRAVGPHSLAPLVGPDAHASITAVLDELGVPVHTVCYECRLGRDDARVDVAVALVAMAAVGVEDVLGRLGRRHLHQPAWQRCLALLAELSTPSSPYAARIPFACVAFDLPGDPAALPAPGLSLCVDPDFFARQLGLPVSPAQPSVTEIVELANACYGRLFGQPLPAGGQARLATALAGGVVARHFSFMVSREPATFKLDIRLPVEAVPMLLRRLDWPGDVPAVMAGIRGLMPWSGNLQLNLVLHPELRPSLEVELLAGRGEVSTHDRLAVLQRLVDAGHCDPAKAETLRDAWLHPVIRDQGVIVARSWYLKVRFDEDRIAEAKGYLGLMPRVLA